MKIDLTTHIYTRAAKANKSGLHPIYIRITLNGKRSEFSTKKYIDPKKWDEKNMRVKGNTEEARTRPWVNIFLKVTPVIFIKLNRCGLLTGSIMLKIMT